MFESMTYENILESLLKNVPSDVDKREGSIIFDTLSPAALELAQMYIQLDIVLSNAFADTAEREYLILRAKERGIVPYEATRAVMRADFNFITDGKGGYSGEIVKKGDRFSLSGFTYTASEQIVNTQENAVTVTDENGNIFNIKKGEVIPGAWKVVCEKAGTEGSKIFGNLLPVKTIQGLTKAVITELIEYGQEAEDTEKFRKRYFDSINSDAFGGNRADYIAKVKAIDGVGQVKAKRTPKGGGTVGIIITDVNGGQASQTIINNVKEKLDPAKHTGEGDGIAPIGHSVTVSTVRKEIVDVYFDGIEFEEGADQSEISMAVVQILNSYADEINSNWENVGQIKIYAAQILARCLEIDGIVNIARVHFDGDNYVVLGEDEVAEFCSNF